MLGRLWPRFALEAFFLVAVALVAGLLNLSVAEVIIVMAVAYLLTVVVELVSWRARRSGQAEPEPVEDVRTSRRRVVAPSRRPPRPEEDETWLDQLAPAAAEPDGESSRAGGRRAGARAGAGTGAGSDGRAAACRAAARRRGRPRRQSRSPNRLWRHRSSSQCRSQSPSPSPSRNPSRSRSPWPRSRRCRSPVQAQEWNLWELERLSRERGGEDPARDVEWGYLVVYLRDFARPDGTLPTEFDGLVRESFGELIAARAQ